MAASKAATRKDQDKPEPTEKTVTVRGIKVTVKTKVLGDVRVTAAMNEAHSGRNPFALHDVFKKVFGDEKYDEIVLAIEDEDGISSFEDMNKFFNDVLKKVAPNS